MSRPAAAGRQPGEAVFPLSPEQERMWLFDRLLSASVSYDAPISARLGGPLNLPALDAAVGFVLARHDSLRTRFPCPSGIPQQVIGPYAPHRIGVLDLGGLSDSQRARELAAVVAQVKAQPFDLAEGPLCRSLVIRLARDEHVLVVSVHHLAADLWSVALIVNELSAGYLRACQGLPSLPPLPVQAGDLTKQRSRLTPQRLRRQREYWRRRFTGSRCVPLPADHPRPTLPSLSSHVHETQLDQELSRALRRLAAGQGVTLFVLLLAALNALIHRWTGHDDLVTVSVTAGRRSRAAEQVVGMLTECLVLRTNTSGDPSFSDLLARVREVLLDAFDHSDLPFADLVALADPGRDLEPSPLRQIGFSLHNTPRPRPVETGLVIGGLPEAADGTGISEADLWLEVFDDGDSELLLRLQMDDRLFEPGSARLTAHRFATLLRAGVRRPGARLSELALIGEAELKLLASWSQGGDRTYAGGGPGPDRPRADTPEPSSVSAWLDEACLRSPDSVAITTGTKHLTYRALARWARDLARQAGIKPGDLVQVRTREPAAMVVGALAAMRAGAVLVCGAATATTGCRSPAAAGDGPETGLRTTLESAAPRGVIAAGTGAQLEIARISVPGTSWPLTSATADGLACAVEHDGLLVACSHRMLLAMAACAGRQLGNQARGPVLVCAEPGLAPSPMDLIFPLLSGQPLILARTGPAGYPAPPDGSEAASCAVMAVPSPTLADWILAGWQAPPGAAVLTDSGLPTTAVRALLDSGATPWVRYTPGGAPGWVAAAQISLPLDAERGRLIYGRPLEAPQVSVLDLGGDPVPAGTPGEVCLAGEILPWGFIGRPGQTAGRFTPDPQGWGRRLWRTGDRARFRWDGTLEAAGSSPGCFQVNGYWVDAAEVAAALATFPGVREAAVGVRLVERDGGVLVPSVVAFIVPDAEPCPAADEIQGFAASRLPWYAVPSVIARVAAISRHANGTADLGHLPVPQTLLPVRRHPPATPSSRTIADLIGSVLGVAAVCSEDNFFRLGGTSMDAVRLCAAIRSRFKVEIPLYDLVTAPTLAGITRTVDAACRCAAAG